MTSLFVYNEFTTNPLPRKEPMLMDIIQYLLSVIQYLYQQNCWLINFICRYVPLKQWAFDDSHSPKYQKFKIDELPLITDFRQDWTYKSFLSSLAIFATSCFKDKQFINSMQWDSLKNSITLFCCEVFSSATSSFLLKHACINQLSLPTWNDLRVSVLPVGSLHFHTYNISKHFITFNTS